MELTVEEEKAEESPFVVDSIADTWAVEVEALEKLP